MQLERLTSELATPTKVKSKVIYIVGDNRGPAGSKTITHEVNM